ncbi:MAG: sugar kinase [Oceanospirillaceae bacterium]|nr:sugar kinase [Oceanospirillaceae bacterium]
MASLNLAKKTADNFDCLTLGEVMLRLDPGLERTRRTDNFKVWEGGGEYNVVQGLSSSYNHSTGVITALVDNEVGQLIASLIRRSGVDTRWIQWREFDGIGHTARNGLYFMERGFGERGAKAVMDRGHTAIAQLRAEDIDWRALFANAKPRWFHVGGVMAGLSEHSPAVVAAAMQAAREVGAVVSYDLNYRDSLWRERGGRAAAASCDAQLLPLVDVLFGIDKLTQSVNSLDVEVFSASLKVMQQRFPNLKQIVSTMRIVHDASHNDWSGLCLVDGKITQGKVHLKLPILDRVGGGDAFAAGYIHAMLTGQSPQQAIDLAVSHGALVMSTTGDNSAVAKEEIYAYAQGADASAIR